MAYGKIARIGQYGNSHRVYQRWGWWWW